MTQDTFDKPPADNPPADKVKSKTASRKTPPKKADASIDKAPAAKPRARKPTAPKAAVAKSATAKPATPKPKSTTSKPAAPKPAAPRPTPTQSAKAKPAKPQSATPQSATPQSAAPRPAAPKHAGSEQGDRSETIRNAPVPASQLEATPARAVQMQVQLSPEPVESNQSVTTNFSADRVNTNARPKSARERALLYWQLMRMHKPIGALLLLWPTLWALWLAAKGLPRWDLLVIFVLGVFVMRSAGCVINDFADRKIDGQVKRTKDRPLATGAVSSGEAIGLFLLLCLLALGLVLLTNKLTIQLSLGGLALAFCYPFMKRYTHLPQVVLGAAFAWSIPMAFAAQSGNLGAEVWLLYTIVVMWTVVYDTFYAMVDRDDDRRIGVKSTAILFGEQDRMMTGILQALTIYGLVMVGSRFELGIYYYLGLAAAAGLFVYQQYLIRFRERAACFKAFLNNNWVGVAVLAGILGDSLLGT